MIEYKVVTSIININFKRERLKLQILRQYGKLYLQEAMECFTEENWIELEESEYSKSEDNFIPDDI